MRTLIVSCIALLVISALAPAGIVAQSNMQLGDRPDRTVDLPEPARPIVSLTSTGGFAFVFVDRIFDPLVLPLGSPPDWDTAELILERIEANTTISPPEGGLPCCRGFIAHTILSGTLELQKTSQVGVIRLAEPDLLQIYDAGRTIVVDPGDTLIETDGTQNFVLRSGDEPVDYLNYQLHLAPPCSAWEGIEAPQGYRKLLTLTIPIDTSFDFAPFHVTAAIAQLPIGSSLTIDSVTETNVEILGIAEGTVATTRVSKESDLINPESAITRDEAASLTTQETPSTIVTNSRRATAVLYVFAAATVQE